MERGNNHLAPALGFASNAQAGIAMTADAVDKTKLPLAIPDIKSSLSDLLAIMIRVTAKQ
jgi:hypothetical protein